MSELAPIIPYETAIIDSSAQLCIMGTNVLSAALFFSQALAPLGGSFRAQRTTLSLMLKALHAHTDKHSQVHTQTIIVFTYARIRSFHTLPNIQSLSECTHGHEIFSHITLAVSLSILVCTPTRSVSHPLS